MSWPLAHAVIGRRVGFSDALLAGAKEKLEVSHPDIFTVRLSSPKLAVPFFTKQVKRPLLI
jgi:hypothetical protein